MIGRFFLGALLALAFGGAAAAKNITLDYQAVMHIRDVHALPVLDDDSHQVGIGAFRGVAIFADDEVASHRYDGWFDLVDGSGGFHGYALWAFPDGSTLRAAYTGRAESIEPEGVNFAANFERFSGTGFFSNVSGEGGFTGRRLDAIDAGGSTYLKGQLRLTVPD